MARTVAPGCISPMTWIFNHSCHSSTASPSSWLPDSIDKQACIPSGTSHLFFDPHLLAALSYQSAPAFSSSPTRTLRLRCAKRAGKKQSQKPHRFGRHRAALVANKSREKERIVPERVLSLILRKRKGRRETPKVTD